jgi:hypothetical protein
MNQYARQAQNHWRTFLPSRYRQIENPTAFFAALGKEAEQQIEEMTHRLAGPDLAGENYLQKTGRLTAAEQQAREIVLSELIFLPAEPGSEMDETDPEQPGPGEDDLPGQMSSGWIPTEATPADHEHPFYRDNPPG